MTIPNIWRTKGERYQLQGTVCNICSTPLFPARHTCPNCSKMTNSVQKTKSFSSKFVPSKLAIAKRQYAMPTREPAQSFANVGDD